MFTAGKELDQGYEIVKLTGAGHEVRILPANGFNLYSWKKDGQELMMEIADMSVFGTKYGIPLLFPTPNRLKDASYSWQGQDHVLTKRGEKRVRHGLVCDEPFTVTALTAQEEEASCSAMIELLPQDDWHSGYPFACRLTVTYTLTQDGVRMDAAVENLGGEAMPFGFALHPYFTKRGDAEKSFIKVPAQRYYATDDELIPTGELLNAEGKMTIHDGFHSVQSLDLDTVYRGLTQDLPSQVRWPDLQLTITASDCFRNAVVFTPKNRPGFCIEPQTCATNFLNLHAQGFVDESGLLLLPAGRTFTCFVNFKAEAL